MNLTWNVGFKSFTSHSTTEALIQTWRSNSTTHLFALQPLTQFSKQKTDFYKSFSGGMFPDEPGSEYFNILK